MRVRKVAAALIVERFIQGRNHRVTGSKCKVPKSSKIVQQEFISWRPLCNLMKKVASGWVSVEAVDSSRG